MQIAGAELRPSVMAAQLAVGAVGGMLAYLLAVPMPFLVGGLAATAAAAVRSDGKGVFGARFPQPVRRYFTAIIGVMIGQRFTPDLLQSLPGYWPSVLGILLFVVCAQAAGYVLFRRVGGYDPRTAYFAAMPGGLIEAITFAERYGADVQAITIQHFARVILVVVLVPFMFLIWTGHSVGSSAGAALDHSRHDLADLVWTLAIAAVGIGVGRLLRLPAGILTGPLLLSAVLQGTGLTEAAGATWLLYLAQLMIGVGLGSSFAGIGRRQLLRAFGLCALSVAIFFVLGFVFALTISRLTGLPLQSLIISFMPGGVTEMSLVALSLNLSPIVVAAHHVIRIFATVLLASASPRFLGAAE